MSKLVYVTTMLKFIFTMLLVVVSSGAAAKWVKVVSFETGTLYADPATIRRNGDIVKMWSLIDLKVPQVSAGHKPYMSVMGQEEYDCKEEQTRRLSLIFYSRNMGGGEVIYTDHDPDMWHGVAPGSIQEDNLKFSCAKR